jgi:hypothetical protein
VAYCEILNGGNAPYSFDMTQPRLEFAPAGPLSIADRVAWDLWQKNTGIFRLDIAR